MSIKLEGIGRIEGVQTDDEGQPRTLHINAVVAGTPLVITISTTDPNSCFMKEFEEDKNIKVEVAQ